MSAQGSRWYDVEKSDDYGEMADMLMINEHNPNGDGVPLDLLLKWYEPREIWDQHMYSRSMDLRKPHTSFSTYA